MMGESDVAVQRELASIGTKIDGLVTLMTYRADATDKVISDNKEAAEHADRNLRHALDGLGTKIERVQGLIAIDPPLAASLEAERKVESARIAQHAIDIADLQKFRALSWNVIRIIGGTLGALLAAYVSHDGLHLWR